MAISRADRRAVPSSITDAVRVEIPDCSGGSYCAPAGAMISRLTSGSPSRRAAATARPFGSRVRSTWGKWKGRISRGGGGAERSIGGHQLAFRGTTETTTRCSSPHQAAAYSISSAGVISR